MTHLLPKQLENALRYYTGDVRWALDEGRDPAFWGDPKAYGTLNALFFPGLANEKLRVAENKPLNPAFLDDPERLLTLCANLIEASRLCGALCETRRVFRVERADNFSHSLHVGHTVAFTSTSRTGFLKEYGDKKGLVLLTYELAPGVACVDMQQALSFYLKSDEAEVLLPPFLPLTFTRRNLTAEEQCIRDFDGNPPQAAYLVQVSPWAPSRLIQLPPLDPQDAQAGQRVLRALLTGETPSAPDITAYTRWKTAFCCHFRARCRL